MMLFSSCRPAFIVIHYSDIGGNEDLQSILAFFDSGNQVIVFGDTDAGVFYRELANNLGLDFYEQGVRVFKDDQARFTTMNVTAPEILATGPKDALVYEGIGIHLKKDHNSAFSILAADEKSYAENLLKNKEEFKPKNSEILLGVAGQGHNNSRFTVFGSVKLCSDEFYRLSNNSNKKFCEEVLNWTLQKKGQLRFSNITHYKLSESIKPGSLPKGYQELEYTIYEHLYYSIDIEELKNGEWVPFESSEVYVEFVMLDPYLRLYLQRDGKTFHVTFQIPDRHGVFQLKTKFNRPGYSGISTASKAPVRPFRHNEFERYLTSAIPYYSSVFATLIGFLTFSFLFLYHKE